MALVSTTLGGACTVTDTSLLVASATSVAAGRYLRIDGETMIVTKAYVVASTTVPVLRVSSAQVLSMSTKAVPTANVAAPDDETDIAAAAANAAGMSSSAPPSAPSSPAKAAASPAGKKTA